MIKFGRNMEHGTSLTEYETFIIFIDEKHDCKFKVWAVKRVEEYDINLWSKFLKESKSNSKTVKTEATFIIIFILLIEV